MIFHLAAAVSGECEADFDLGIRANLTAGDRLLEAARALGTCPVLVFASSLAVFGQPPGQPLPDVITDTTLPTPLTSYGTQKFMLEQLVADYARKGFIRGRSVRLMTVSVRPGRPNRAASGFLSGIIREPLAGIRAACPVAPETEVALSSPARTVEGLLRAAGAAAAEWGPRTGLNLPSVTTTVGGMVRALGEVAGPMSPGWSTGCPIRRSRPWWPPGRGASRRPGGRARPAPGPGLRLDHQDAPRRVRVLKKPADRGQTVMTAFPALAGRGGLVVEPHPALGQVAELQLRCLP